MLLAVVGQAGRGGHIQPAVTVEVGQDHISVVGGGRRTWSPETSESTAKPAVINQDAADGVAFSSSFVHEEDVGVFRTGEGCFRTHTKSMSPSRSTSPQA